MKRVQGCVWSWVEKEVLRKKYKSRHKVWAEGSSGWGRVGMWVDGPRDDEKPPFLFAIFLRKVHKACAVQRLHQAGGRRSYMERREVGRWGVVGVRWGCWVG